MSRKVCGTFTEEEKRRLMERGIVPLPPLPRRAHPADSLREDSVPQLGPLTRIAQKLLRRRAK